MKSGHDNVDAQADNSAIDGGQGGVSTAADTPAALAVPADSAEVRAAKAEGVEVPGPEAADHLESAVPRTDEKESEAGELSAVKEEHIERQATTDMTSRCTKLGRKQVDHDRSVAYHTHLAMHMSLKD